MTTAAVILAAGASTRLGSPKQLVMVGGESLLGRAVRVAREAGCEPIVVVLGASAGLIRSQSSLNNTVVVVNEDWAAGMGGSIGVGVSLLRGADGCIVMTCDMPAVTAAHLRLLMSSPAQPKASSYAGRRGVPAYFPAAAFKELMELQGDVGARELLREAHVIDLVGGELDVDTVGDLGRVREILG